MKPRLLPILLALSCRVSPAAPAAPAPTPTDTVSTHARTVTSLAHGVYAIRHEDAPDTFPQSNTLVVIGTRDVLVVDSCYLPSTARKDIAQIKAWTDKPVRYLVNTHWHYDHTMGNAAYVDAFPGVTIVAHVETQKQIRGYNVQWFAHFAQRADRFRKLIADGKSADGKPFSAGELDELRRAEAGVAPVAAEFHDLGARADLVPSLAFDRGVDLDLGDRVVQLRFLGRGNTAGDIVAYLPAERIVATGDLVDHPVPYLGGGYPIEEVATLEALARLPIDTLVPGHGDVLHGTTFLQAEIDLLRAIVGAVDAAVHDAGNGSTKLDQVRAAALAKLDLAGLRQRFAGDDPEARDFFDDFALDGAITAAYAELWPR